MANEIIEPLARPVFDYSIPRPCKKCGAIFSGMGCRECKNESRRARRAANPDKEKPQALAYRQANREKIRLAAAEYRLQNPEKIREIKIRWRDKNSETISEQRKLYRQNSEDKCRLYSAKYRLENKALIYQKAADYRIKNKSKKSAAAKRYREENPEKVKAQFAAWVAANPEANRIRVQNRRARRKANGGSISNDIAGKLLLLQKGKCPCCKQPLGDNYHLDHIVPLALGGTNTDDNIQLLRAICNQQKHAKHPIDFMQSRGFLL